MGHSHYMNEFDPHACRWLKNLMADGQMPDAYLDPRDMREIIPDEVRGYTQAHFFTGIGGWPLALRLTGWPQDVRVWTASLPCQPFSSAGKRKAQEDERHLWPHFYRIVRECLPPVILGEQVASADGYDWLDGVRHDLEEAGYAFGAADLPACSQGAPHIRQRLFWVGISKGVRIVSGGRNGEGVVGGRGQATKVKEEPTRGGCKDEQHLRHKTGHRSDRGVGGMGNSEGDRPDKQPRESGVASGEGVKFVSEPDHDGGNGPWSDFLVIPCRDGKSRRISSEPGVFPLAHGIPARMGPEQSALRRLSKRAKRNRTIRLRGYGNAIVPALAAVFIRAVMETIREQT